MEALLFVCVFAFSTPLRHAGGQPLYDSLDSNKPLESASRTTDLSEHLATTMRDMFKPDRGVSALPVDIAHYNLMVETDSTCGAKKIDQPVNAAFLVYIHKGFHTDAVLQRPCQEWGKWAEVKTRLDQVARGIVNAFAHEGYRNVDVKYVRLAYPGGAFNPVAASAVEDDVKYLTNSGNYYDAVKLGVSTGQFQYVQPSVAMQYQWLTQKLNPICLHRLYGGWFQFAAILMVTVPGEPLYSYFVWDEIQSTFVSESEGQYHLLARALGDGLNDVWRDYPEWSKCSNAYDLRSYTWEKTGVFCSVRDSPFVKATRIAFAFNNYLPPDITAFASATTANKPASLISNNSATTIQYEQSNPQERCLQVDTHTNAGEPGIGPSEVGVAPLTSKPVDVAHDPSDTETASASFEPHTSEVGEATCSSFNCDSPMTNYFSE